MASRGRTARFRECIASGEDTQKNWRYSAGAYQTGDAHGTPSLSAVASVMYLFESMIDLATAWMSFGSFISMADNSLREAAPTDVVGHVHRFVGAGERFE